MRDYKDDKFIKQIIKAVNERKLIIFVGAGVSRLCGLPSWDQAANDLLEYCTKYCDGFNYAKKEKIINNVKDAKEKITIGYYLLSKVNGDNELYYKWLKDEFSLDRINRNEVNKNKKSKMKKLIRSLSNIVFSTNVDLTLDEELPKKACFYKQANIHKIKISNDLYRQIWHIHGSLDYPEDIVFTTRQYLERYTNNNFRKHFFRVFNDSEYTILFLGYGFSELQLLDFLVNAENEDSHNRLFLLQSYFDDDEALYDAEEPYFLDYGIQLIKYPRNNGYEELFDVLEYLKKQVDNSTTKPTELYSSLQKVFSQSPTVKNKNDILNQFSDVSDKLKCYLVHSIISKSKYASKWLYYLANQEKFAYLFDLNSDLGIDDVDDEPFNIKNIRFLLNEYANNKDENLFIVTKQLVMILSEHFKKENALFENNLLVITLLKTIFCDHRLLNLSEAFSFVKQSSKVANDKYCWMCYSNWNNETSLLKSYKKTQIKFCELAILNRLESKQYEDYNFDTFFEAYGNEIAQKQSYNIFNICFDQLTQKINSSNYSNYNVSGEVFDKYKNRERNESPSCEDDVIRWMISTIIYLDSSKLHSKFKTLIKSEHKFERCLAIYMCNSRFSDLRSDFFRALSTLSRKTDFPEIYSLILNHNNELDDNELNVLYDYISTVEFDESNKFINLACKIYLCDLLLCKDFEDKAIRFNELKNNYKLKLSENEIDFLSSFKPFDVGKMISTTRGLTIKSDDNIKQTILRGNIDEFIKLIKKSNDNQDKESEVIEVTISENFQEIYDSLELHNLDFEKLMILPPLLIHRWLHSFANDDKVSFKDEYNILFKLIDKYSKSDPDEYIIGFANDICSSIDKKNINEVDKNYVFNKLIEKPLIKKEYNWRFDSLLSYQKNVCTLFSSKIFFLVSLLIYCANKNSWPSLKNIIEGKMKKNEFKIVTKGIVVFNLKKILSLDYDWVSTKIEDILNNEEDGYNYSFAMYSFSTPTDSNFINLINDKSLLLKILDSNEFTAWNYSTVILSMCIKDRNLKVVNTILSSRDAKNAIYTLLKYSKQEYILDYSETIIEVISKANELIKEECSALTVEILKLAVTLSDIRAKLLSEVIKFAKKGFIGMDIKKVINIFQSNQLNNEEEIKVLKAISVNISGCHFYYEDIIRLFKEIDWKNNLDDFNELIVMYRKHDPDLSAKLYDNHKLKYRLMHS